MKGMFQLDISAFEKIWKTEYICEKVQRVSEHIEAGSYDSALGCLICDDAKASVDLIKKITPPDERSRALDPLGPDRNR